MSFPAYPDYKDSGVEWLGKVPSHWEVMRLKRAADAFPSNVDKKTYDDQEPVKLCNYVDVYYNEQIDETLPFMEATASPDQVKRFTLRSGDTIITKDSETADDIGVAAYVPRNMPGVICGYHLTIVRPRKGFNGRYIKRVFDGWATKAQFETAARGLTRVGLPQYAIDNVLLAAPSESEQATIATFLDRETGKIDALVAEQEKLIELLKEKRQAVISHAVTKGLDPKAPMKDSGIKWLGEVPAHWDVIRLGGLFHEVAEQGGAGLPILSVSIHDGVSDRELSEEEMDRKVTRSDDLSKYKKVCPGDLVYNMMRAWQGGFGAVVVAGQVSPAYVVARPQVHIATPFIESILRTPKAIEEMRRRSHGVTDFRLRLYWDEFKAMKVALPSPEEQETIMDAIDTAVARNDALADEARNAIRLLKERRSALISAAVTGKIDVRGLVDTKDTEAA